MKHSEPRVKHHYRLIKHRETSWNTQLLPFDATISELDPAIPALGTTILVGDCLHSGLSLAWDHFRSIIADPCIDWRQSHGYRLAVASLQSMIKVANISLFIYISCPDYIQIVATRLNLIGHSCHSPGSSCHLALAVSPVYIYIYQYGITFFPSNLHLWHIFFRGKCMISHLEANFWINPLSHESQCRFIWTQIELNFTSILFGILHLAPLEFVFQEQSYSSLHSE